MSPLRIAVRLGLNESNFVPSSHSVRAYDNTQRAILGGSNLGLSMGLYEKSMEFQVIDILASFDLLFGSPWIPGLDCVASSLHQKIKFIIDENKDIELYGDSWI